MPLSALEKIFLNLLRDRPWTTLSYKVVIDFTNGGYFSRRSSEKNFIGNVPRVEDGQRARLAARVVERAQDRALIAARGDKAKKNPNTGESVAGPVTLSDEELAEVALREAALASLLLLSSWEIACHARWVAPDGLMMSAAAFAILLMARSLNAPNPKWWLRAAAVAVGICTAAKYPGGILLPFLGKKDEERRAEADVQKLTDQHIAEIDKALAANRDAYKIWLEKALGFAGIKDAKARAQAVFDLEVKIAQASWPAADRRDHDRQGGGEVRGGPEGHHPEPVVSRHRDGAELGEFHAPGVVHQDLVEVLQSGHGRRRPFMVRHMCG